MALALALKLKTRPSCIIFAMVMYKFSMEENKPLCNVSHAQK